MVSAVGKFWILALLETLKTKFNDKAFLLCQKVCVCVCVCVRVCVCVCVWGDTSTSLRMKEMETILFLQHGNNFISTTSAGVGKS